MELNGEKSGPWLFIHCRPHFSLLPVRELLNSYKADYFRLIIAYTNRYIIDALLVSYVFINVTVSTFNSRTLVSIITL